MQLVDAHAHLNDEAFADDRLMCLERARGNGVVGVINAGVDRPSSLDVCRLAETVPNLWATAGVHPHSASEYRDDRLEWLREALSHSRVVAVGEVGLDYHYDFPSPEDQKALFCRQVRLAVGEDYPVVVHSREALPDILAILREELPEGHPVLLHCFSGDLDLMKEAVARGYHLSFGGLVTFKNADSARRVAENVPLEHLLLETDAPYLAPVPRRGRRNEPAFLLHTAASIARRRGMPVEELARRTTENAAGLFGLDLSGVDDGGG